jgi:tetratricopeptide (TPR) repeat protein
MSRLELRQGAVSESLKAARQAVRISPDSRDAHEALARAWEASDKPEQAAAERKIAAAANAARPVAEQRIVQLYANASAAKEDASDEQSNRQLWTRAMQEYTAGKYSAASADLKTWLAVNHDSGTGWAILGLCEFELKDFDNALIHLDRGSKLGLSAGSESLFLAKYTLGILLVHAGEFDRAADILSSAIGASGPLAQKVEFALGLALLRKPEFPDAVNPSQTDLISDAGRIEALLYQSQYDKAFPQLKLLINRYPAVPFLHYAYGTAFIALSQFDQAAAQMEAERSLSPSSELPCVRLASIALREHDSAAAITWSQQALQLAPNSVDAHYLLGRASLENGDVPSAIRELEIAAKLSPASPEVHFNLAKAYARAKMTEKAQQERDIFSRLNDLEQSGPGHQGSQVDLGPRDSANGMKAPPSDAPTSPRRE